VSVKLTWWAEATIVGRVPPTVFWPEPNVDSALVDIRRHDRQPAGVDREWVFDLIGAGFGQRRKMLRRSLAEFGVTPEELLAAGVRPTARAEELVLSDWVALASSVARP
jgi:16S rRNA (adenine1518-N6/adenine1519-N6)-dimethyltransferase